MRISIFMATTGRKTVLLSIDPEADGLVVCLIDGLIHGNFIV